MTKRINGIKLFGLLWLIVLSLCLGAARAPRAMAADPYQLLAPLPLTTPSGANNDSINPKDYITGIIRLAIAVAGGLAVVRIIFSGIQYMSTDAFSGKSSAKDGITEALWGLLLVIGAYTILYTINPQLVNFNVQIAGQSVGGGFTGPAAGGTPPTAVCGTGSNVSNSNCGPAQALLTGVDQKGPGGDCTIDHCPAGAGCRGTTCYVDQTLASKLVTLKSNAGSVGWTVTEMAPPTVTHIDSCHTDGTCVDASLSNPTHANIAAFLTALDKTGGLTYEYETCDQGILSSLQSDPSLAKWKSAFKCESTTKNGSSGQSLHIESH